LDEEKKKYLFCFGMYINLICAITWLLFFAGIGYDWFLLCFFFAAAAATALYLGFFFVFI
jgi:hypothetical protein